jgi:hypothetical protein
MSGEWGLVGELPTAGRILSQADRLRCTSVLGIASIHGDTSAIIAA